MDAFEEKEDWGGSGVTWAWCRGFFFFFSFGPSGWTEASAAALSRPKQRRTHEQCGILTRIILCPLRVHLTVVESPVVMARPPVAHPVGLGILHW